jgi:hypothetical protein
MPDGCSTVMSMDSRVDFALIDFCLIFMIDCLIQSRLSAVFRFVLLNRPAEVRTVYRLVMCNISVLS